MTPNRNHVPRLVRAAVAEHVEAGYGGAGRVRGSVHLVAGLVGQAGVGQHRVLVVIAPDVVMARQVDGVGRDADAVGVHVPGLHLVAEGCLVPHIADEVRLDCGATHGEVQGRLGIAESVHIGAPGHLHHDLLVRAVGGVAAGRAGGDAHSGYGRPGARGRGGRRSGAVHLVSRTGWPARHDSGSSLIPPAVVRMLNVGGDIGVRACHR